MLTRRSKIPDELLAANAKRSTKKFKKNLIKNMFSFSGKADAIKK
jgi:hypothetical protein